MTIGDPKGRNKTGGIRRRTALGTMAAAGAALVWLDAGRKGQHTFLSLGIKLPFIQKIIQSVLLVSCPYHLYLDILI